MSKTIFEQIGGAPAVDAAVDIFYRKVLTDDTISGYFDDIDMDKQRAKQKSFLTMVFGGPHDYTGKSLRDAHSRLVDNGLNDDHFNAVAGHLKSTLDELNVPSELINQVLEIAESTRGDILGQ